MVGFGRVVPEGHLPVFSVDHEAEAKMLIVATCSLDLSGNYFARELAQKQTLENLKAFGDRIATVHQILVKNRSCTCQPR